MPVAESSWRMKLSPASPKRTMSSGVSDTEVLVANSVKASASKRSSRVSVITTVPTPPRDFVVASP